jgi:alpha-tubulin suppressor-like RCC1 family protein
VVLWGNPESDIVKEGVPAAAQTGAVMCISAGDAHALLLMADGRVVSLGSNTLGQSLVPSDAKQGVTEVLATAYASIALKRRPARWWSGVLIM